MYIKLALRNAVRSMPDYLLYMFTMIMLLSIMFVSNYLALVGNVEGGFRTGSLPFLISMILTVLVGYTDSFMVKQRSKEFASYLLLGMEKKKLLGMFLLEVFLIGTLCFLVSAMIGSGICFLLCGGEVFFSVFGNSGIRSFVCFLGVELLTMYCICRQLKHLEIRDLMSEKKRSEQPEDTRNYRLCRGIVYISAISFMSMLCGIAILPEKLMSPLISLISVPLFLFIFSFYRYFFQRLIQKRQEKWEKLYKGDRLYLTAEMTSAAKSNAVLNGIFCSCFLFSAGAFLFGDYLLRTRSMPGSEEKQWWMGFLQISICIIFMLLFFFILSTRQMIDIKKQIKELEMIYFMGKDREQLQRLLKKQVIIKLSIPVILSLGLLIVCLPIVDYRMNLVLAPEMNHFFVESAGKFLMCFCALYLCYYHLVCYLQKRYLVRQIFQRNKG